MRKRYWIAGAALAAGAAVFWRLTRNGGPRRVFTLDLPAGAPPAEAGSASVQFIGTATALIRYNGLTILTDPNFLHRGEQVHIGYGMHSTRLTDPAMEFDALPPIDFVVLSHLHEDHFDKRVQRLMPKDTPILTTACAARALRRKGFSRIYGLRTWDRVTVHKGDTVVRLTAMPGTHGPLLVSAMLPDVMGSMLEFQGGYRMYISGDTLVFRDLKEIPKQYPNIDLALLHLGGTRVMGILVTMDAEQGVEVLRIVQPDVAIPVHYDDYDVFKSPLSDFKEAVAQAGLSHRVRYLQRGDRYEFTPRRVAARPSV